MTLPGHLPAVAIEQTEPCHRAPDGRMSSPRNGKPILVRVFSEKGLDLDFGADDCFVAVALNGVNNVGQLNGHDHAPQRPDRAFLPPPGRSGGLCHAVDHQAGRG